MYMVRDYVSDYRQTQRSAANDDPRHVVALLLAGAMDRIRLADTCIRRRDIGAKVRAIGGALDIIDGLRLSLDHAQGGELAARLDALYDYMTLRLVEANLKNDSQRLEEVLGLLGELESAWSALAALSGSGLTDSSASRA